MTTQYEPVMGFEVHTELLTQSKVWCGCSTHFGQEPNTQVCPVCLGLPGSLPVLNKKAFDLSLLVALALRCKIPSACHFDRKNYYYPDLPKNYQISQQYQPLGTDGVLEIELPDGTRKAIGIDNIHLEEDAGKNIHPEGRSHVDYTLIDLNRAGTPLLEIVSRPDIRTKAEAEAFMKGMKQILEYLEASDCKMEEGRLRFELNISLRPVGSTKLGQKVEIKNLNSITTVMKCIDAEIERQSELLLDGKRIAGETRLWDEVKEETRSMRSKETAFDYRYFPDPDLVEITISEEKLASLKAGLPELPNAKRQRFIEVFELPEYDAGILTADKDLASYFEAAVGVHPNAKSIANWMMTEVLRALNDQGSGASIKDFVVKPGQLAELVKLIDGGAITGKIAKAVYPLMVESGKSPSVIVEEQGLKPVDDSSLDPIVAKVIAENPKMVEQIREGKLKAIGGLMGIVMKETGGKANPQKVQELIKAQLGVEA
jgi:aspartyl-tRNA(Asn)/glutamyl-tRNA(Gln) amidotransferase subunit B